jgi:hypothetical protein
VLPLIGFKVLLWSLCSESIMIAMQTTIKPLLFEPLYNGRQNIATIAAWLFTLLVLAFGFRYALESIAALLLKLYQLFIQKNALNI